MSLLKDYCITCDEKGNYILEFNTFEAASVVFSTEKDGTNLITLNTDAKGETNFLKNYGNASKIYKYKFDQPDDTSKRKGEPTGTLGP